MDRAGHEHCHDNKIAFDPSQTGAYNLEARALIFTELPLDWGPAITVTATINVPLVLVLGKPMVTNSQVRPDFTFTSGYATTFKLLQADQQAGAWTTNGSATLTTNVPGSSYRFTTTVGPAARFYRVKTPQAEGSSGQRAARYSYRSA